MSSYAQKRFLPCTPALLFELVAAVDLYPEFLPWCLAVRIRSSEKLQGTPEKALIVADLVIGSRMIRERYRSRVTAGPNASTLPTVECPFRYLNSHWIFEPVTPRAKRPGGGTMLTYHIKFEFRSRLLESLVGGVVRRGKSRMGAAFERRAKRLYRVCRSGAIRPGVTHSQGDMLVDALFQALVHGLANANASLKVASTRRK